MAKENDSAHASAPQLLDAGKPWQSYLAPAPMCSVYGCENNANRVGAGLCEMHYMRMRRRGTTDRWVPKQRYEHTRGYVLVRCAGHPLVANRRAPVEYEHRVVYYNANGAGPFACYHCGTKVSWPTMHVDHLNDEPTDNRIANLMASCPVCNQQRGAEKMRKTQRSLGVQLTAGGKTQCVSEWAREIGISRHALMSRLERGWSQERALTTPGGKTGPRRREGM
jgi:5-methylcytosine-specific restriction endonuclease McrA